MLTLLNLKYFCDVVETGSFTKAGQLNHVAQTSISQQIKKIEKKLGTTLLNRRYKPIKLTQSGKVIYREAKKVLNQYQSFTRNVDKYLKSQNKKIHIGYDSINELNLLDKIINNKANVIVEK